MTIEAPNVLAIIVIAPFIITGCCLVKLLIEVSQPVRVASPGVVEQLTHLVLLGGRFLVRLLSVHLAVSRLLLLLSILRLFLFVLLSCHVVV